MSFIFISGRPGTGKTTLAASMTKLGYKVLFLDVDQKINQMMNIHHLVESGMIQVIPITEKLTESTLEKKVLHPNLALLKEPKGYLSIVREIDKLEQLTEPHECQVFVLDSLTSSVEHLKRLISHLNKKTKFSFDEWGDLLANLEELFYSLMRLQNIAFKHVIVLAHEMTEKDEDTGSIISILPAIEGSMRNKVGKYFAESYRTVVEVNKQGEAKYFIHTKPMNKAEARTSRDLPPIVGADFSIIFKEEIK